MMATITSTGTGNWPVALSATPAAGDTVNVIGGHQVTVPGGYSGRCLKVNCDGGVLKLGNGTGVAQLVFDDAAGAGITVHDSAGSGFIMGSWDNILKSASAQPVNPWKFIIEQLDPETRNIYLDGLRCQGNSWVLSNSRYNLYFNDPADGLGLRANKHDPLTRTPRLDYHDIDGRAKGRTYPNGLQSGSMVLHGYGPYGTYSYLRLEALKRDQTVCSIVTDHSHMPRCYITDVKYRPSASWYYFDIYLQED